MRSCRRSLTQYFDQQQERRRIDMASASVATSTGYGWCSSGYGTCSSLSDDDLLVLNGEEERESMYSRREDEKGEREETESETETLHPGICPHCKHIYKKPVTLTCGHSLCNHCCVDLLSRMEMASSVPRNRPRMGISSYSRSSFNKTLTSSWNSLHGVFSVWKSPRCAVCGESPKKTPPVPNLTLEAFLTTIRLPPTLRHLYEGGGDGRVDSECSPLSVSSLPLSTPSGCSRVSIRDCTISIVGSRGVGKSSLLQSQLCNDMLIDELLGRRMKNGGGESPLSDISSLRREKGGVTYMLKMMENGDLADKISLSMGVVVIYSIIDRESFYDAKRLLSIFTNQRGVEVPMVVVGTKSDLTKRRKVLSYEGQQLAKQYDCPFIEVSSRRNECVNEAFIELVRVMESRCLFN